VEVVLLRQATEDALAAWSYFDALRAGGGAEFDAALDAHLQQLAQFPLSAPQHSTGFRRLLMTTFDYGIYYRVIGNRVAVSTLINLRLSPIEIERRLREMMS
jgi:hypothetical protein